MPTSIKSQLIIVLFVLMSIVVVSWNAATSQTQKTEPVQNTILENMGLRHDAPVSIALEYTTKSGSALLQITHRDGDPNTFISVPDTWERKEVRGVDIEEQGKTSFGFVEWPLPAGASYQFFIPREPHSVLLHNPSGSPAKTSIIRYNFATGQLEKNVFLVQSDTVPLW